MTGVTAGGLIGASIAIGIISQIGLIFKCRERNI
jgi:hypothetical protein